MGYKNRWQRDRAFEAFLMTLLAIVFCLSIIWVIAAGMRELYFIALEAFSVH